MKNIITLLFCIVLISCQKEVKKETEAASIIESVEEVKEKNSKAAIKKSSDQDNLLGYYVGGFRAGDGENSYKKKGSYTNKINISVDHIKKDSLFGHSVVAGNLRPFKGTFDLISLNAKVTEPGDDKYDGMFEFSFVDGENKIKGVWIANNSNLAVAKRKYTLEKRRFSYNPELNLGKENIYELDEEGEKYEANMSLSDSQFGENNELESINPQFIIKLNASTQTLTSQDIENLNKGELEVLRNMIYARHGYSFKNRKMRYFFDSHIDWYMPVSTDIRNELTALEKKNIDLIKRYEEHAERYYDYFGR